MKKLADLETQELFYGSAKDAPVESNGEGLLGGMEVAGFPQNFHVGSYLRIGTFNVSAIVNLPLWREAQEDNSTFIIGT